MSPGIAARAAPTAAVEALPPVDRARLEAVEARLVREAVGERTLQPALDLAEDLGRDTIAALLRGHGAD